MNEGDEIGALRTGGSVCIVGDQQILRVLRDGQRSGLGGDVEGALYRVMERDIFSIVAAPKLAI